MNRKGDFEFTFGDNDDYRGGDEFKSRADGLEAVVARVYQPKFSPENWREFPGATQAIEKRERELRSTDKSKPGLQASTVASEAWLYAAAARQAGTPDPYFIIHFHNPLDPVVGVMDDPSTALRDLRAIGIRAKHYLLALRNTRGEKRKFISLRAGQDATGNAQFELPDERFWPDEESKRSELARFDGWPPVLRKIFELCVEASEDTNRLNAGLFDHRIEELCKEFEVHERIACAVDLPEDVMTFSWRGARGHDQFKQHYLPTESWQTFRANIGAPAGADVLFDPYQTPCYMWIRKAIWHGVKEEKVAFHSGLNGAIEELFGLQRLSIYGPAPVMVKAPASGLSEIEIEFLIQADAVVLKDLILSLNHRLTEKMRGRPQGTR